MAWRNLRRRGRRTLLTAMSVGGGLWVTLLFTGMANHNWKSMIDTSARMGFGHVTVEPAGYLNSPSSDKRISLPSGSPEKVMSMPHVTRVLARVMGEGIVATASKSVGGSIIGMDPAGETAEYNFFLKSIVEGEMLREPDGGGVMVGDRLAEKLNLKLGKKLVYTSTDVHGNIVSDMARITGIFRTGVDAADGGVILLPINRLRRTLGYAPNEATLLAVFLDDNRRAPQVRASLAALGIVRSETWTWQETQPEIAGTIKIDRGSHLFFQFFLAMLVSAGILDTILMSVLERQHEFGVMLAVGTSPEFLFRMVLAESFFIALIGMMIGIVINLPFYIYLNRWGFDFSFLLPQDYSISNVPIDPVLKVVFFPENVAAISGMIFILAMVAGLYPAWKASRVPPVESIRTGR